MQYSCLYYSIEDWSNVYLFYSMLYESVHIQLNLFLKLPRQMHIFNTFMYIYLHSTYYEI